MVYNPYIVIPAATWAIAQIIKFAISALRGRLDFRNLYASGGMPSVHSAVVCALAVTAWLVDGSESHLFGLAAVFGAIVIYDSLGVRRAAGEQGRAINALIEAADRNRGKYDAQPLLREVLGHNPGEVLAGSALGIVLAGLFNYDKLNNLTTFLQTIPGHTELYWYVGIGAVLVVAGFVQRLVLLHRYPKSPTMRRLTRQVLTGAQTIGWLTLVATIFQYERASYLAWRLWVLLVLLSGVVWAVILVAHSWRRVPQGLADESQVARKMKWFNMGRKRKKRS